MIINALTRQVSPVRRRVRRLPTISVTDKQAKSIPLAMTVMSSCQSSGSLWTATL